MYSSAAQNLQTIDDLVPSVIKLKILNLLLKALSYVSSYVYLASFSIPTLS